MVDVNAYTHLTWEPDGDAADVIAQLRRASELLRDHCECSLLAFRLNDYLEEIDNGAASASLDRSLGLKRRGGVSPARAVAIARRDDLIRRVWREVAHWNDLPPSAAARQMSLDARRYETDRWPRECDSITAPLSEPAGTWWRIRRSGLSIPDAKQLQKILQTEFQSHV